HRLAPPRNLPPFPTRRSSDLVAHAVQRTLGPQAGPVHLNASFRDPLAPVADDGATAKLAERIDWDRFFSNLSASFAVAPSSATRSDEHTSEIQSRRDLVCRLL